MTKHSSLCSHPTNRCRKYFFRISLALACLAVFAAAPCQAAVINVPSGTTVRQVLGTPDADRITIGSGARVIEFVAGEGNDDYIVNNGHIGWYLVGYELGEGGSPTVINNGTVTDEMLGAFGGRNVNDVVTVDNRGIVGDYLMGGQDCQGRFIVKNSGTVYGDIWGSGNLGLFNPHGHEFTSEIYNTGTVKGSINGNFIDYGNTYIENDGTVEWDILGITLGTGYTVIINRGTVMGGIGGGLFDDFITLVGGCYVGLIVDGWEGKDTLIFDNMGLQAGSLWGSFYVAFEYLSLTGIDNRFSGTWQMSGVPVTVYNGNLTLLKGASLNAASLSVASDATAMLYGSAAFTGAVTVGGGLVSSGGISAGSLLVESTGSASFLGPADFSGPVVVSGGLASVGGFTGGSLLVSPTGSATFSGSAAFGGQVSVRGGLAAEDTFSAGSIFVDSGASATFSGATSIGGAATVNGSLASEGSFRAGGAVNVAGSLTSRGVFSANSLGVGPSGSAYLYGPSSVSRAVTVEGLLSVDDTLSAGSVNNSGQLWVNGLLVSPEVTIAEGGSLHGGGRIRGDVYNGGAMSPGHSPGLFTVEGNYTQNSTALFVAETEADGATDLLHVTDRAFINGGTLHVSIQKELYPYSTAWTIIQADGGVSGAFDLVTGFESTAVMDCGVFFTPNTVQVELNRVDYRTFAKNPNDAEVAGLLDRLLPYATGGLKDFLWEMDWTMSAGQIREALDELSPEMYAAFEPASFEMGMAFDRAMALRMEQLDLGGAAARTAAGTHLLAAGQAGLALPANAEDEKGWAFWGRGLGVWSTRNSDQDYLGWDQKVSGAVLGVDATVNQRVTVGASLAATKSDLNWTKEGLGGDMNGLHAGFYGRAKFGPGRLRGSLSYARLDADAEREIDYPGFSATAKGSFSNDLLGARLEYGYGLRPGGWMLEPMAALAYQYLKRDGFTESGAGNLGVLVDGGSADSFSSRLGARLARDFKVWGWDLLPRLGLFWVHRFDGGQPEVKAAFPDRTDMFMTVHGLGLPENTMLFQAGLEAAFNRQVSLFADYGHGYSDQGSARSFSAGLKFSF